MRSRLYQKQVVPPLEALEVQHGVGVSEWSRTGGTGGAATETLTYHGVGVSASDVSRMSPRKCSPMSNLFAKTSAPCL